MNIIKPENLQKGGTIAFLSLSGVIEEKERIFQAKDFFERLGFKVVLSDNIFDKCRYMAGSDEKRIKELHEFFLNPEIDAILCTRGGYGAIRIVEQLDYDLIRKHPKIFCGYSDITAISLMIYKKAGLITYSSPMAYGDFGESSVSRFTVENFFKTVESIEPFIFETQKIYRNDSCDGVLWGGNLATVVSLCGLDFIPDEKFIFFTEDLNEPVYKIDRMFTQLINIEKFRENLAGIALGEFLNVDNTEWLDEFITETAEKLHIPIASGFKITHAKDKITLPVGVTARLDNNVLSWTLNAAS